jgi:serine/threonine protein kinase
MSSDIWAAGCIFFRLLTGYHPFAEDSHIAVLFRIFKTMGTPAPSVLECPTLTEQCPIFADPQFHSNLPRWTEPMPMKDLLPHGTSEHAIDLLRQMLQVEPSKRISADIALRHSFFTEQ